MEMTLASITSTTVVRGACFLHVDPVGTLSIDVIDSLSVV